MKIERNAPCPCGSGKKYKKCCWNKEPMNKSTLDAEFMKNLKSDFSYIIQILIKSER